MTTGERIMKLETQMQEHCKSNEEHFINIENKLDGFIKSADSKFASKITEKVVYGLIGMIITAFVILLLIKVGWR